MPIYKVPGKRKDGLQKYKVRINYTDDFGENRQLDRIAYGYELAKELERKLNYEIKQKTVVQKVNILALFEEYCEVHKHEVRETTLNKLTSGISNHILPMLANVKLDNLTMSILQKWKSTIEQEGLALKTRQNIFGNFRALLNFAVKMGYMTTNPLSRLGNFRDAYQSKPDMDYYTADEFRKYISAARKYAESGKLSDWDYYVFFCVAFYTGLRKGEIHALKWTDINGDYLSVSRSIAQKLRGEDRETPPKNASSFRTLQMPLPLLTILLEHKARYGAIEGFTEDFRICGGTKSLRDTSVDNANIKFAKLAELKKIRIHDFRHSHVSLLANEGINIQEIARRLGHSKIDMTWNTYSHLYPREEERAVQVLNLVV
jgi:integrase